MSEISLLEPDDDLIPVLRTASNDQLEVLVRIITKDGWQSSELDLTNAYKQHSPNHTQYVDEIAAEVQKFGGNTIANVWRGHGRPYAEIVCWTAKKLRVDHKSESSVAAIELSILTKQERKLESAYQKMTTEQRAKFLSDLGVLNNGTIPASLATQGIQALIRGQGFKPYIWLVKNANWIWRALTGAGLTAARNRAATRMLSWVLAPEVGIALTAIDALRFMVSPARRVIIPSVIQIASIRLSNVNVET